MGACSGTLIEWQEARIYDADGNVIDTIHFQDTKKDGKWSQITLGDVKAMCSALINTDGLKAVDDQVHGYAWGWIPRKVTSLERTYASTADIEVGFEASQRELNASMDGLAQMLAARKPKA